MVKDVISTRRKEFGQRLKELRGGKSQGEIVKMISEKAGVGITAQTLGRYECGTRSPDMEIIEALAYTFDVSADYLLCLTDIRSQSADISSACLYTHLSEKAVEALDNYYKELGFIFDVLYYDVLSEILSDEDFYKKVIGKIVTLKQANINPEPSEKDRKEFDELLAGKKEIIHKAGFALVTRELVVEAIKADFGKIVDNILDTDIPEDK